MSDTLTEEIRRAINDVYADAIHPKRSRRYVECYGALCRLQGQVEEHVLHCDEASCLAEFRAELERLRG